MEVSSKVSLFEVLFEVPLMKVRFRVPLIENDEEVLYFELLDSFDICDLLYISALVLISSEASYIPYLL